MDRRYFFESLSETAVGAWLGANVADLMAAGAFAAATPPERAYEFLTDEQARLMDAISAQLVPTDDTPGAREAHVVRFIDHSLATFAVDQRKNITDALADFDTFAAHDRTDNKHFLQLTNAEQIAALREYEKQHPRMFNALRGATMTGMFSHPEHGGNYRKVGWRLIGFVDQYSWVPPFGYYDRV